MCQQKEILKNYLDLPPMLRALTAAIMTDYQYVFELAPTIDENGLVGNISDSIHVCSDWKCVKVGIVNRFFKFISQFQIIFWEKKS